ncbi:MAG: hypothetical protein ACLP5H_13120 [Desulfomonilaceae bacterium]
MAKRTLDAKEILDDIKAGLDSTALMEKYQLSEKGLQSLFKKLMDAGVLKPKKGRLDKPTPAPEKAVASAWKCPICGNPQNTHYDKCPECSVIAARFQENIATTQQLGAIKAQPSPSPEEFDAPLAPSDNLSNDILDKLKEVLRNPYGLVVIAVAALIGFIIGAVLISTIGPLK